MSLFKEIGAWVDDATSFIKSVESKADAELTAIEAYTKANAPIIAQAVDGILTTAQTVTGDIDPAAEVAVTGLKDLFDSLISLIEHGTQGATPPVPVSETKASAKSVAATDKAATA